MRRLFSALSGAWKGEWAFADRQGKGFVSREGMETSEELEFQVVGWLFDKPLDLGLSTYTTKKRF